MSVYRSTTKLFIDPVSSGPEHWETSPVALPIITKGDIYARGSLPGRKCSAIHRLPRRLAPLNAGQSRGFAGCGGRPGAGCLSGRKCVRRNSRKCVRPDWFDRPVPRLVPSRVRPGPSKGRPRAPRQEAPQHLRLLLLHVRRTLQGARFGPPETASAPVGLSTATFGPGIRDRPFVLAALLQELSKGPFRGHGRGSAVFGAV
mmetsp:Transcript_17903/g.61768  ORF Transcript_17903/g.61768 Transcript_17903/m.61768 type:complete len:202 (+) Transcript_17903:356-961(+)